MSGISTHILDTSKGRPASGIEVQLFQNEVCVGHGCTDKDGRIAALLPENQRLESGPYLIRFATGDYFPECFYPEVTINFLVRDATAHHHVPLLISPFGYTTYRGS